MAQQILWYFFSCDEWQVAQDIASKRAELTKRRTRVRCHKTLSGKLYFTVGWADGGRF